MVTLLQLAMSETKEDPYFSGWYAKNGEKLNEGRRNRYETDQTYRDAVLKRNRDARQKRKVEVDKEKAQERKATKVRVGSRGWKTVEVDMEHDGETSSATLFTIGALARTLGRSVQAIRLWEKRKELPVTPIRNAKGDRLYTLEMVDQIREIMAAKGKVPKTTTRQRRTPKSVLREVNHADGHTTTEAFFQVGVLANAIQRTVVTVEILETKGFIPCTPFRASGTQYRVYTLPMINAVRVAFEARNGEIRGDEEWEAFAKDVRSAWETLGVFGASLVAAPTKNESPKKKKNGKENKD